MRCPNCHEEMRTTITWINAEPKREVVGCPSCHITFPGGETEEKAWAKYHHTIKKIREFYPERLKLDANITKARHEIYELKLKKRPCNSDVKRMAALVSYEESYINAEMLVREMEILNARLESLVIRLQVLEGVVNV